MKVVLLLTAFATIYLTVNAFPLQEDDLSNDFTSFLEELDDVAVDKITPPEGKGKSKECKGGKCKKQLEDQEDFTIEKRSAPEGKSKECKGGKCKKQLEDVSVEKRSAPEGKSKECKGGKCKKQLEDVSVEKRSAPEGKSKECKGGKCKKQLEEIDSLNVEKRSSDDELEKKGEYGFHNETSS